MLEDVFVVREVLLATIHAFDVAQLGNIVLTKKLQRARLAFRLRSAVDTGLLQMFDDHLSSSFLLATSDLKIVTQLAQKILAKQAKLVVNMG